MLNILHLWPIIMFMAVFCQETLVAWLVSNNYYTHDLSPSLHPRLGEIAAKAHQRANCILRCFLSGDVNLLVRAFIVYVRPIVQYCSVVWSPSLKQDIDLIEKVQRRFIKRLRGLKAYSYSERLQYLGLTSLELRRQHLDLIFCYKIVFTVRRSALHGLWDHNSVRLSVCLSHSWTVSTRFDLRSWFLRHMVAPSF